MIDVLYAYPESETYRGASEFAKDVYKKRLCSDTTAAPDLFACALQDNTVIGCLGLYRGDRRPAFLFEMCRPQGAIERLVGSNVYQRIEVGELGTRAVVVPSRCELDSAEISTALIGALAVAADRLGMRYLGFVTNRLIKRTIEASGFEFIALGEFDLAGADEAFRENMKGFVAVRQLCAGFRIVSLDGCERKLAEFASRGVRFPGHFFARK